MAMTFRNDLRWLTVVVSILCAGLVAHAVATLIDMRLAVRVASLGPPANHRALRSEPSASPPALPFTRNIFCSTCPLDLTMPRPSQLADDLPPSRLPLRLLATMVAASPASVGWSTAVIGDQDSRSVAPYAIGSRIRGATITDIESTRVTLLIGQRRQYLDLLEPPRVPIIAPAISPLEPGIRQVGPRRFEIPRAALDHLLGDTDALSRAVRVAIETRSGHASGLRLLNVQPDGPIARIGLQSDDIVSTINGLDLTTAANALTAYTKLRSASHLELGLERAGARLTQVYDIR